MKAYNAYWSGYLKGDIKKMASLLAKEYIQVGSAESEVFFSKKDAVRFLRDTIDQVAGKLEMRNRNIYIDVLDNLVLINELADIYVLIKKDSAFYSRFRVSTLMTKKKEEWKIIHQHSSFPDSRTDDGENIAIEKIAEENQQLREAVKRRTAELEEKNRDLEIEAALEKVRAIATGMKEPAAMLEVCKTISLQLEALGVTEIRNVQTAIIYEDKGTYMNYEYYAKHDKTIITETSFTNHEMHKDFAAQMLKGKGEFYSTHIRGKKKLRDWIAYQKTTNVFIDSFIETANSLSYYWFSLGPVALGISTYHPLTDNDTNLFRRFINVFELSYRRYLDIEKAEAQAKEVQIELALERVRARTMAMRKSDELLDVIQVLSQQFLNLDFNIGAATFALNYRESNDFDLWLAVPGQPHVAKIHVPYINHPLFNNFIAAKEKGLNFFVQNLSNEEKNSYFEHFFKAAPGSSEEEMKWVYDRKGYSGSEVLMKSISLGIANLDAVPYTEEENSILKRFAAVFEQSYVRFLDLQKAEEQARESKIEAAMEKVRARAMAMQKAEELTEVAQVLRKEMGLLGVEELETSSIYIHDEVSGTTECWYAIQDIREQGKKLVTDNMTIHLNDTWVGREMLKFYRSAQRQTSILMQGENRKEWINYCAQRSKVLQGYYGDVIPERTYHLLKFSNGYMGAASPGDISAESWDLLKRATTVFSLAFTRFNDLQLAEANAKEATKQSALDRVRAEIASMRTVGDLEKITPLIWNELTILGIPFIRCGVFIMDESQHLIHTFLSTPDGKAIAAFHLPYDTPGNIGQALSHWRNKKNYIDHWNESAFIELAGILARQGAITSSEQYLSTIPSGGFYLHFLPFLQGMLYVGNSTQLSEGDIRLIQSVADAFSTAYARYEDFSNLEAAKQTVEKTLFDLKQAQAQLVQSEKMASLGQLTAGIAHEIQNPLNFVNNFSEVSSELIEEMTEEIKKGNLEEVKTIAGDVKQNLEKINHHGKRADAIVKGMLQHSRSSTGQKESTDINSLADEYIRLCYHGLRAKDKSFNATIKTDFDTTLEKIDIIPQDIGRAILNLLTNAFYTVNEKKKENNDSFEPTVSITTKKIADKLLISVMDNGDGIPEKALDKIFQPFYTTKPTGQGTGLGLSLSYDIIKAHGGEIKVVTKEGEGSDFIIQLPA